MKNLEKIMEMKAEKLQGMIEEEFKAMEFNTQYDIFVDFEEMSIWFVLERGQLKINICLDKDGYQLSTERRGDEEEKNVKTVKGERAVINYIDRVL